MKVGWSFGNKFYCPKILICHRVAKWAGGGKRQAVGWFGVQFEALPSIRGAWKVSKSIGHTQKCHDRYQEHQNRTTGAKISPFPMYSRKNGFNLVTRPPIEILRPLFTLQLLILPTRDPFHAQKSLKNAEIGRCHKLWLQMWLQMRLQMWLQMRLQMWCTWTHLRGPT